MFLSLTTTAPLATDLGFLLMKNPANLYTRDLAFGKAYVFYPEATEERCTAVLWVEVDPVELVRGLGKGKDIGIEQYVNDRPYVASSLLSVAIAQVFSTALSGRSKERPARAAEALPLEAVLPAVRCTGGEELARALWEPLGYEVRTDRLSALAAGARSVLSLRLLATRPLHELLEHLYVLLPVLDDAKHYFVGPDEVEKLLRRGEGWLPRHPARELIVRRYLRYRRPMVELALERLDADEDDPGQAQEREDARFGPEGASLSACRLDAVVSALRGDALIPSRILDLGCGQGALLERLAREGGVRELVGVDVSPRCLARAAARLRLDSRPPSHVPAIKLLQGSAVYRDARLKGFEAAALVEVLEHVEPERLPAFERAVFGEANPKRLVLTTPNAEFNVRMPGLRPGERRHPDHRFEWDRETFRVWCARVAETHGYHVRFLPVGPEDPQVGPPTQLAVFDLSGAGPRRSA
ncbi:MAG: 3' terminal RNA ribose 2'-O-methyltransferase Hen1 [Planctomycetes bacterium]|nr:3' terminal RNA ribose 2'-O-methyltransferase Hen1 [Planctomycetota bacterium]